MANYQALSSLGLTDSGTKEWQHDSLPPSIDRQVDQTPNALLWFNVPLNLTAIASDATSGLASLETSLDNTFWSPYSAPLHFSDGVHTLYLRAVDHAGNVETLLQTIQIDSQNPQLNRTIRGTSGTNGWYISAVQVEANQNDPAPSSGIQYFETSLNGANWHPYTAPLTLHEGAYVLQIRVSDNADNQDFSVDAINVDTTPPELQVSFSGTPGSANWYVSPVEISAAANDATSGIVRNEYSLDGGAWQPYTTPLTLEDGVHTIQFKATDTAGLSTGTQVYEFKSDTARPHIELPSRWYIWESGEFIVKDDTSKIAMVGYTIADPQNRWKKVERNWTPDTHQFSHTISWNRVFADGITAPIGSYKVTVYAEDTAGNRREKEAQIIIPAPNATALPTFTPTPTPTNTPIPTATTRSEAAPVILVPTATPFVFNSQPSAAKEQSGGFTFSSPPAEPKTASQPSDGILWGAAAAAAIGLFAVAAEATRKRREALRAEAARREKLQAIWDANGAAIYAANEDFKKTHGTEVDAATKNKAIKDATQNGVFDAEAYAANLVQAATPPPTEPKATPLETPLSPPMDDSDRLPIWRRIAKVGPVTLMDWRLPHPEQGDTLQTLPPGPMCTPTVFDKPKPWWVSSFSAQEAIQLVRTIPSVGVGSKRIPVPVARIVAPGKMISFGTVTAWKFGSNASPGAELRTDGFGAGTINEPDKPSAFARVNLDTGEISSSIRFPVGLGFTQDGFSSTLGYSISARAKWDGWNTTASIDLNYVDVKASGVGVKGNISRGMYLEVKPMQVATVAVAVVAIVSTVGEIGGLAALLELSRRVLVPGGP